MGESERVRKIRDEEVWVKNLNLTHKVVLLHYIFPIKIG